jgi:hypothetical protein
MQIAVILRETSKPINWVIDQPPKVRITARHRPDRGTIGETPTAITGCPHMTTQSERSALWFHFVLASTKPRKQRKRNEYFAKRSETFRTAGRKALNSLWVLNQ